VPVIAPTAASADGETYNINADTAAGAIAAALGADKLLMLTDIEGVLDGDGQLLSAISPTEVHGLIEAGVVSGGMIPKLETCLAALDKGVGAAHILDGRLPHVVLLETFTEAGVGTKIDHHR